MNLAGNAVSDAPSPLQPVSSLDYLPREPLRGLQSQRLRQVVGRSYEHVPLYRQRMQKHGLTPAEIRGVDDLDKLPLTTKADLRDAYGSGVFAVPLPQIARLHPPTDALLTESAAKPIVAAFTRHDLAAWTETIVRGLACCGVRPGDIFQNACGSDVFAGGLGLHYGAEALGAVVIPIAGGDVARRIGLMKDFGVSVVCSTPSYFLYLAEQAEKIGVDLHDLSLRVGVFVGEPWSEAVRRRIEESAGIKAHGMYGPAEILGPGVGAECCHRNGLHLFEDHFYPEIIDPATGQRLADDQEGELVLTTLDKEAMPLIRYRTGEPAAMLAEPCPCGRTMRRIRPSGGQGRGASVLQGIQALPSQVEAALRAVEGTLPGYRIVLTQQDGIDQVEVQVEVTSQILSDRVSAMENLQNRLAREIEHTLGTSVAVRLVEPHTLERGQGGAGRIVDKRGG